MTSTVRARNISLLVDVCIWYTDTQYRMTIIEIFSIEAGSDEAANLCCDNAMVVDLYLSRPNV